MNDWLNDPKFQAMYEQLKKVRESKTVELRPTPMLRSEITGFDGKPQPLRLRYYQVQGVFHLLSVNRMVLGDGTGLGKTCQVLCALCYLWEKNPQTKVMVICPKSALMQWASELDRFVAGAKSFIATGTPKAREKAYREWASYGGPSILLLNYHGLVKDWDQGIEKIAPLPGAKKGTQPTLGKGLLDGLTSDAQDLAVIFDECTAFKTPSTKTHQTAKFLSDKAKRVWGLTATLLKNRLEEGFGIYKVIRPQTFTSKTKFLDDYCQVEMQRARGGIRVPVVIGYKNLAQFRSVIDPFFYGRAKHQISSELPALTTREVLCELSPAEDRKYAEALQGVMLMGDGDLKDYQDTKDLTALIYCQQVVNSLALLKFKDGDEVDDLTFEGKSAKESALIDLLTEEYADEKVIVYTRFEKHVGRIQELLAKERIKSVRITGAEGDKARKKSQDTFQDMNSPVKVVLITDAASEAINLQAAQAMVFFDSPWSWGTYVQCLDMSTEVLTKQGFKHYSEVSDSDLVAAFEPATSEVSWEEIQSKVCRPLAPGEEMYAMSSPHVDVRVTGGHRMLFKRQSTTKSKKKFWPDPWRIQEAESLAKERSHFRIPACGIEPSSGSELTDSELEFIGWFLTDGTMNHANKQVSIPQAIHQPQIHDLRRTLNNLGFDYHEYSRIPGSGCYPNGKPQINFSIPKGTGHGSMKRKGWVSLEAYLDKDFSPKLENLDPRQLGILLEAVHLGDGAKQRNQSWTRRSWHIFTANKTFADRLQSLCVRRGFRCNVARIEPDEDSIGGYNLHIKKTPHWSLIGANDPTRPKFKLDETVENEEVWCVSNKVGTLITRRNGKVTVVGNCIGRMIRIGSPHPSVSVIHLLAERPGQTGKKRETIDHKVIAKLRSKKGLIDQIIGEAAQGALRFERSGNDLGELLKSVKESV